jgi:hypothetical protein
MNRPCGCATPPKLPRNAAGGLFTKPSFFLFHRPKETFRFNHDKKKKDSKDDDVAVTRGKISIIHDLDDPEQNPGDHRPSEIPQTSDDHSHDPDQPLPDSDKRGYL